WSAWGSCLASVRTGRPSFNQVHDATLWQYLAQHPEIGAIFHRFMTAQSRLHNAALVESYDFSAKPSSTSAAVMAARSPRCSRNILTCVEYFSIFQKWSRPLKDWKRRGFQIAAMS